MSEDSKDKELQALPVGLEKLFGDLTNWRFANVDIPADKKQQHRKYQHKVLSGYFKILQFMQKGGM